MIKLQFIISPSKVLLLDLYFCPLSISRVSLFVCVSRAQPGLVWKAPGTSCPALCPAHPCQRFPLFLSSPWPSPSPQLYLFIPLCSSASQAAALYNPSSCWIWEHIWCRKPCLVLVSVTPSAAAPTHTFAPCQECSAQQPKQQTNLF